LLARRRKKAPELLPLSIARKHDDKEDENGQETVRIRQLEPGEKIFDLYRWSEVIQEEGCGGKVVICAPKVPGEVSPSSPSSPVSPTSGKAWRREDTLGSGAGNETNVLGGTHVMKIKSKEDLRKNSAEEQFRKAHLKMLNLPPHMGILPLHEVLEDQNFFYVVMERANGGSLLRNLVEEYSDGVMPEKAVKQLMREILSAIDHIHKQGLLHRDIKIDNLVVEVHDEPSSPGGKIKKVRLIDFDMADPDWIPNSPVKKQLDWVGTVRNSAPETFGGHFSQSSDLYSVGTVLYLLMTGRQPYDDAIFDSCDSCQEFQDLLSGKLAKAHIDWNLSCWKQHPVCRDFCMWLLTFDPDQRPASAEEAAEHQWFTGRLSQENPNLLLH